jgi:hypothetical protein
MLRTLGAAVVAASLIAGPALADNTANAPVTTTSQPAATHHVKHVKHVKHLKKYVKHVKHVKHIKQVKKQTVKGKIAG